MKKYFFLLAMLCSVALIQAQTVSVTVEEGGLRAALVEKAGETDGILNAISDLTIAGTLNITDFYALREIRTALTRIDLSKVTAISGREIPWPGFNQFSDLATVLLPETPGVVTTIGEAAFSFLPKLKTMEIPEGVTTIGGSVFRDSGIESLVLPNTVTSLGREVFAGCTALKSIILSENLTAIPDNAFNGCSELASLSIPEGVKTIGGTAFQNARKLKTVELPSTLEELYNQTFRNATALETVTIYADVPPKYDALWPLFRNIDLSKATLYVPASENGTVLEAYKSAEGWNAFWTEEFTNIKEFKYEQSILEGFEDIAVKFGDVLVFPTQTDQELPVTYTIEEGKEAVATLAGNKLTVTGAGEVQITATQAGNLFYSEFEKTITVTATATDYSWLLAPAIDYEGDIARVVGPGGTTAIFTKFYVGGTEVPLTGGAADISGATGTIELKATTADGKQVIRLVIKR